MPFAKLLTAFKTYSPHTDTASLLKAHDFSRKAHENQNRASGEDYFIHCMSVAEILTEFKMDLPTVAAGFLHDVLEDTKTTPETLKKEFGDEITSLVQGVTKLDALNFTSKDEAQAENWRKMMLATAQDIRV